MSRLRDLCFNMDKKMSLFLPFVVPIILALRLPPWRTRAVDLEKLKPGILLAVQRMSYGLLEYILMFLI